MSLRLLSAIGRAALALAPAGARELTPAEAAALTTAIVTYEAGIRSKNAEVVVDFYPPGTLEFIAGRMAIDVGEVRRQAIQQMSLDAVEASLEAFDIREAEALTAAELSDGTVYVIIPTTMVVLPGDGSETLNQLTVAMLSQGEWSIFAVRNPIEVGMYAAIFPAFGEPSFAAAVNKALQ